MERSPPNNKWMLMLHQMFFLLADGVDPISGGAGWLGAGLLGMVLSWLLLKHLPDKDKQLKDLLDKKDEQIKEVIASKDFALTESRKEFITALAEQRSDYKEALQMTSNGNERQINALAQSVRSDLVALGQLVNSLSKTIESLMSDRNSSDKP